MYVYCLLLLFSVYYDVLTFKNLPGWEEIALSGASQLLETGKGSAQGMSLICKLENSEPHLLCLTYSHQTPTFPALHHSRTWYQAVEDPSKNPKSSWKE